MIVWLDADGHSVAGLYQMNLGPLPTRSRSRSRSEPMVGRVYLERGQPVTVLVQWGLKSLGQTHGGPRNVLIERADGSRTVRPFRGLRKP